MPNLAQHVIDNDDTPMFGTIDDDGLDNEPVFLTFSDLVDAINALNS